MSTTPISKSIEKYLSNFLSHFDKERDRVIPSFLISIIDERLKTLIKKKLIRSNCRKDFLLDGAIAPLNTVISKIEVAFRLGLIGEQLKMSIHQLHDIRNEFSRKFYRLYFSNGTIKQKVLDMEYRLSDHSLFKTLTHILMKMRKSNREITIREKFILYSVGVIFTIDLYIHNCETIVANEFNFPVIVEDT